MQNLPDICRQASLVLLPLADPARALAMKAYMKQRYDFLGVPTPARRLALKPLLAALTTADTDVLLAGAERLWAMQEREFQYAAIDILAKFSRKLELDHLPAMLELKDKITVRAQVVDYAQVLLEVRKRPANSP